MKFLNFPPLNLLSHNLNQPTLMLPYPYPMIILHYTFIAPMIFVTLYPLTLFLLNKKIQPHLNQLIMHQLSFPYLHPLPFWIFFILLRNPLTFNFLIKTYLLSCINHLLLKFPKPWMNSLIYLGLGIRNRFLRSAKKLSLELILRIWMSHGRIWKNGWTLRLPDSWVSQMRWELSMFRW